MAAGKLRVPGLLLFLGLGMAIGSDGTGWIPFENYELARTIGIIALALILFEGGLTSGLVEIRPVLGTAMSLALIATPITAAIAGLAAAWLFDIDTKQGLLIGAVLASTDGAAIFALLRNSTLRRKLARALEGESGLNDPVAVLLVLALIEFINTPGYDFADAALLLVRQLGIGLAVGVAVGWLGVQAFRRAQLATAGLYPVASLAIAALAFGGVLPHPRRLRLLEGVRDRAPLPRRAAAPDRRGHLRDPAHGDRPQGPRAEQDLDGAPLSRWHRPRT